MHLRGLLSRCSLVLGNMWLYAHLCGSCSGVDSCAVAGLLLICLFFMLYSSCSRRRFVCLCVCLVACSFGCLFVCLVVCLSVSLFVCSACLFLCWLRCLSVRRLVCLSVCLFCCSSACLLVCVCVCSVVCLLVCLFACFVCLSVVSPAPPPAAPPPLLVAGAGFPSLCHPRDYCLVKDPRCMPRLLPGKGPGIAGVGRLTASSSGIAVSLETHIHTESV
jgi:hypothetical protein